MELNRKSKPFPIYEVNFNLPDIERFSISNGLKVLHVQKSNLPIIRLNLLFYAGSRYDEPGKEGLANLFGMAADEGAGNYNALEISDELDSLGSSFSINRDNDSIYYSLQTLSEYFDKSLDLFTDVLLRPHFSDEAFAREQRKILTRIMQSKDAPDELADMAFEQIIYGKNNPYAHPVFGYEDTAAGITNTDVKNFYKKYIVPSNAVLVCVGDITVQRLRESLENKLKDWKGSGSFEKYEVKTEEAEPAVYLLHKEGTVQSEIRCGHLSAKRNNEDYFAKSILNMVLGGQFSSRINLNLRENKGYTYGALSRFNYHKEAAHFYVSTSVGAENTANAVKEIQNELVHILDGITPEELEFAKFSMIRKFPSSFETLRQISVNLLGKLIYGLSTDFFNTYIDHVKNITRDEVNSAAVKSIFPDKIKYVVAGDKNIILPQLKELNFGEIIEINPKGERL